MSQVAAPIAPWDIPAARALYNITGWGAKYFDINDAGHVIAMPLRENGAVVDVTDVIEEAKGRGLKFPVLIRFQDILRDRVEAINQAFAASIAEFNYQNKYRGVFPIKVNQLREVVEEILDAGKPHQFGLEVGSKPELFAGLALQSQQDSLIICNGYKDAVFIRMALMGIKLGKKVIMVVEKLEELKQIIAVSRQMGVEPLVGIRARLLSKGAGKWADSGGENAKFGLNTAELLAATEMLRAEKMEHCFKFLHFHIGSQVPDILTIKKAVQEAARFYAKLYKMGFAIESLDVGGGLGVDYDGSRSASDSSTNYTLQEYANDIVYIASPRRGWPIWARCTRIWWVRPVSSWHSSRTPPACRRALDFSWTSQWVTALRPPPRTAILSREWDADRSTHRLCRVAGPAPPRRRRSSHANSPGAAVIGELLGQRFVCAVVLGRHHQPGGVLVEPVHDAGRITPPIPDRLAPQWAISALTSVPVSWPAAGCTTSPAGLSMTMMSSSS